MPFIIILALIFGASVIPDMLKQEDRRIAIQKGLEECPNPRSNFSNDTIWVKDCEGFLRAYNHKEENKELEI